MFKRMTLTLGLAVAMLTLSVTAFCATVITYSDIADAVTSEVTGAIPAFVALIGIIIGVPLALRVVKRIAR